MTMSASYVTSQFLFWQWTTTNLPLKSEMILNSPTAHLRHFSILSDFLLSIVLQHMDQVLLLYYVAVMELLGH